MHAESFKARLRLVLVSSLLVSACGGGSSGTSTSSELNALTALDQDETGWTIGSYFYSPSTEDGGQSLVADDEGLLFVLSNFTEPEPEKGDYSVSNLSMSLTLPLETGEYVVTDGEGLDAAKLNGSKAASIAAFIDPPVLVEFTPDFFPITTGGENWTRYISLATVGTVSVLVRDDGNYVISTTEPLYLTKSLQIGTGIAGAPDTVEFNLHFVDQNPFAADTIN